MVVQAERSAVQSGNGGVKPGPIAPRSDVILEECLTKDQRKLFRDTIDLFHSYVKYKDTPTRRIYWLVYERHSGNQIGAVGLASATLSISIRDKAIGWSRGQRHAHLRQVANNSRFCLIRDRVTISNAASQTLKQLRLDGRRRWQDKYGDPLVLLETYVLAPRETPLDGHANRVGACYRADNWIFVGETQGNHIRKSPLLLWARFGGERGRLARENPEECLRRFSGYLGKDSGNGYVVTKVPKKMMFIRPLVKGWKEILCRELQSGISSCDIATPSGIVPA